MQQKNMQDKMTASAELIKKVEFSGLHKLLTRLNKLNPLRTVIPQTLGVIDTHLEATKALNSAVLESRRKFAGLQTIGIIDAHLEATKALNIGTIGAALATQRSIQNAFPKHSRISWGASAAMIERMETIAKEAERSLPVWAEVDDKKALPCRGPVWKPNPIHDAAVRRPSAAEQLLVLVNKQLAENVKRFGKERVHLVCDFTDGSRCMVEKIIQASADSLHIIGTDLETGHRIERFLGAALIDLAIKVRQPELTIIR